MFLGTETLGNWPRGIPKLRKLVVRSKYYNLKTVTAYLTAPTQFYPMNENEANDFLNVKPWYGTDAGLGSFMDPDDDCNEPLKNECVKPVWGSIQLHRSVFEDSQRRKPWTGTTGKYIHPF